MAEILEEITRALQTRDASLQEWMDKAAASTTEGRHGITSTGAGIGLGRDDRR
jgi:hypothetical protein